MCVYMHTHVGESEQLARHQHRQAAAATRSKGPERIAPFTFDHQLPRRALIFSLKHVLGFVFIFGRFDHERVSRSLHQEFKLIVVGQLLRPLQPTGAFGLSRNLQLQPGFVLFVHVHVGQRRDEGDGQLCWFRQTVSTTGGDTTRRLSEELPRAPRREPRAPGRSPFTFSLAELLALAAVNASSPVRGTLQLYNTSVCLEPSSTISTSCRPATDFQ